MTNNSPKIKMISLCLVIFSFWNAVLQPDTAFALQSAISSPVDGFARDKILFPEFARVEWVSAPAAHTRKGMVYLFQDAHTSLLAQKRITQTLLQLRKQKALDGLLVEGATGNLTTERFNHNPNLRTDPEFIEKLERQGYLHGAAAYYLAQPETLSQGMESPALYRRNADLFRRVFGYQKKIQPVVSLLQVEWQRWLKNHVPEEYQNFFLTSASKHTNSIDPDFFKELIQIASDRLGMKWEILDQKEWPNLIRVQRLLQIQTNFRMDDTHAAFKKLKKTLSSSWDKRLNKIEMSLNTDQSFAVEADAYFYRDFAADLVKELSRQNSPLLEYRPFFDWLASQTFRNEVEPEGSIDEIEKLENQIWGTWFKKANEQSWMKLGRLVVLLDKASRLELSRRDVRQFQTAMRSGEFQNWVERFAPDQKDRLIRFCVRVIQFYAAAEKREAGFNVNIFKMLETLSKSKSSSLPQIAVVFGGYHKEGLLAALKARDLEVALVTPHLERIDQDVDYLSRMLQTSTLSFVPAAVQSPAVLREMESSAVAEEVEQLLVESGLLTVAPLRSEARSKQEVAKPALSESGVSRRTFGWMTLLTVLAPVLASAQDALDKLVDEATQQQQATPKAVNAEGLKSPVFSTETLKISSANGMQGFLSDILGRIDRNLPGQELKWQRVAMEAQTQRMTRISFYASSNGAGQVSAGSRVSTTGSSEYLELTGIGSDAGISLALKAIGVLIDEIFVMPVRNKADAAALLAADKTYEAKRLELAGEVAKLTLLLRAAEAKNDIFENYIANLKSAEQKLSILTADKAMSDAQLMTVRNYLNEALDSRGQLEVEMTQAREGLKILLGNTFDFKAVQAPVPVRAWLDADTAAKQNNLIASAQNRAGDTLQIQASQARIEASQLDVKAKKRGNWFTLIFRRGSANAEKTRNELGLGGEKLARDPSIAGAQVNTEAEIVQMERLRRELGALAVIEGKKFFVARNSHERWQKQVYDEQQSWESRALLTETYDLTMLELQRRFFAAQLRIMDTRAAMSGSAIVWTAAGLDNQSANSANWMKAVLLSGFSSQGFKAALEVRKATPSRSEARNVIKAVMIAAVTFLSVIWSSAMAQQPAALGGPVGGVVSSLRVAPWEDQGKIHVSSASGEKAALLQLKVPEMVMVDSSGKMSLSAEGETRYQNLKQDFSEALAMYQKMRASGSKILVLLPQHKVLFEKWLELDRFERMLAALTLPQSGHFKVLQSHPGTYGPKQAAAEFVTTRIAKVQLRVPLQVAVQSQIRIQIGGQDGVLLGRPRVIDLDASGSEGHVLIEITAVTEKPLDLENEISYHVWFDPIQGDKPVSNGEPVLLSAEISGKQVQLAVALLLRKQLPVQAGDFGSADLEPGISDGNVSADEKIGSIPSERPKLEKYLVDEADRLAQEARAVLPSIAGSGAVTALERAQLEQDAGRDEIVRQQLASARNLVSPATGQLEVTPELASGMPLNAGDVAARIHSNQFVLTFALTGDAVNLPGNASVTVHLADGRMLEGKVQSIGSSKTAHVDQREVTVIVTAPVHPAELDWSALTEEDKSAAQLYADLAAAAQAQFGLNSLGKILNAGEFAGPMGAAATGAAQTDGFKAPTLAELIAQTADAVEAHRLFEKHKKELVGADDSAALLQSKHLSLTFESVKLLLHERGDWAEVTREMVSSHGNGDGVRTRAIYDAVLAVLISGGEEVESGLKRLGLQMRSDLELKNAAQSVFSVLMVDRGLNDPAVRRVLDSGLWTVKELADFSSALNQSGHEALRALSPSLGEFVWRRLAADQIAGISKSAYLNSLLSGRNPRDALEWMWEGTIQKNLLYDMLLSNDRHLLSQGVLPEHGSMTPTAAGLIDEPTSKATSVKGKPNSSTITFLSGVIGANPATLGGFELDKVEIQAETIQQQIARGDFNLAVWILHSQASESLKKTTIAGLKKSPEGRIHFFRWMSDKSAASYLPQAVRNYGRAALITDLVASLQKLEDEESAARVPTPEALSKSTAPKRHALLLALRALLTADDIPVSREENEKMLRAVMVLIPHPMELGRIAQGAPALSEEGRLVADLFPAEMKGAAARELARRAVLTAASEYPKRIQAVTVTGQVTPGAKANAKNDLTALMSAGNFVEAPSISTGDAEAMPEAMRKAIESQSRDDQEFGKNLDAAAQAYFDAALKSNRPSAPNAMQTNGVGIFYNYLRNSVGFFVLGIFSWLFFRQALVKARKLRAMNRGEAVQFHDSLPLWQSKFKEEVLESGIMNETEAKTRVIHALKEWSEVLAQPKPDYQRIEELMRQVFSWPNLNMRIENFRGFRNDDRSRDKLVIYALTSLTYLTLKQMSEQPSFSKKQSEVYQFLRVRSERLVIFSYILFQLKNLKENESYNAVEPNIANNVIQRERRKAYSFQRTLWAPVRKIYALNIASRKIRASLRALVDNYAQVSAKLQEPVGIKDLGEINAVIDKSHFPRERWGASPDNSVVSGDRKLATRIFNFVAGVASLPMIFGQANLLIALLERSGLALGGTELFFANSVLLFSTFTFLSHLFANLANLHDVQAEEFMNHLGRIDNLVANIPMAAVATAQAASSLQSFSPAPAPLPLVEPTPLPESSEKLITVGSPIATAVVAVEALVSTISKPTAPKTWRERVMDWQNDDSVNSVVIYVTQTDLAGETAYLLDFFKRFGFSKSVYIQDVEDASRVTVIERQAAQNEILNGETDQKVVFMRSQGVQDGQRVYGLMKDVPVETKAAPAAVMPPQTEPASAPTVTTEQPALTVADISAELSKLSTSGFDGILIAHDLPEGASPQRKKAMEQTYRDVLALYGVRVPVQFVDVRGVENGNGLPALSMMAAEAEFRAKLASAKPNPKLVVLEVYGPQYDAVRLMAGSTFYSDTGMLDANGRAITTGALALARASIALRDMNQGIHTMRLKTDTVSLYRAQPQQPGEINLAAALLPAKKAARLGVPIFDRNNPTKLYGFLEKGAKDFLRLYADKMNLDESAVDAKTLVPTFTGDITTRFPPDRQKLFDELVLSAQKKWNEVLAENPKFEFDEVLDFWVPLIYAANGAGTDSALNALRGFVIFRSGITNSGLKPEKAESDKRHAIYSDLHTALFRGADELGFKIHGQIDKKAPFRDVRRLKDLVRILREASRQGASTVKTVEAGKVMTIGLNGTSPKTALTNFDAFMLAVPYRQTKVTVYGSLDSFRSGRPDGIDFGIPIDRILGNQGQPLFDQRIPFIDLPLFPTGEPTLARNETFAALLDGKRIRFPVNDADGMRNLGYVSLRDIAEGYDPSQGGMQSPAFQHLAHIPNKRSEARVAEPSMVNALPALTSRIDLPPARVISETAKPRRSDLRNFVGAFRNGEMMATVLIFYGIVSLKSQALVGYLAKYAPRMMKMLYSADLKVPATSEKLLAVLSNPDVQTSNTLFLEAQALPVADLLANLNALSEASFKVVVLFTRGNQKAFELAREVLDGKTELRNLKIEIGANVLEMLNIKVGDAVRDNPDVKNQIAFAGRSVEARRARTMSSNLIAFEGNNIPWNLVFEAITSPAVFNFYRHGSPNKIWSIRNVVSVLISAAQAIARAA